MVTATSLAHYPTDNRPKFESDVYGPYTLGPKLTRKIFYIILHLEADVFHSNTNAGKLAFTVPAVQDFYGLPDYYF